MTSPTDAPRQQRTIAQTASVRGFGYWSGRDIHVEFRPAPVDTGIVFVRGDLDPHLRIPATLAHRIETPRRTTLTCEGARVEMVEHAMAALAGTAIDNCEVWLDGSELPGLDGSSQAYVEALDRAGSVEQQAGRDRLVIREVTRLGDEDAWIEARPASDGRLTMKFRLDYGNSSAIGRQTYELPITPATFRNELAASRTFLLKAEADWLLSQGLGTRASTADLLVYDDEGPIDNTLRFENECVRHKLLDLVGDLALCGRDIVGHVIAYRSGHRLNAELVRALLSEGEMEQGWRRSA